LRMPPHPRHDHGHNSTRRSAQRRKGPGAMGTLNSLPADVAKAVRERILANSSAVPGGCWEWNLSRDRHGYARTKIQVEGRRWTTCAHRASYLAFIGAIPRPLQVDHLCDNTICVNPG